MLYHVWFGIKGRRWLLLGEVEEWLKPLLWDIAGEKAINLLECETVVDHVHLLLRTEPQQLPSVIHLLKGVSGRRVFQRFPELKTDIGSNSFWQVRYAAKAVPEGDIQSVLHYLRTQKERLEKFDRPYTGGYLRINSEAQVRS